jgi:hypothetical protein
MANQNAPHGFSLAATQQSNDFNAQCHMYAIPSTDATYTYAIGDAVQTIGGTTGGSDVSNPWGTFGIAQVSKCPSAGAATMLARGIVIGIFRNPFALDYTIIPQTKTQNYYVMVHDDPYGQYIIQGDNAGATTATWVGSNAQCNLTNAQTFPATYSGLSSVTLNTGAIATTNTLPLKILGFSQQVNLTNGAFIPFIVTWNTHELKTATGTTT